MNQLDIASFAASLVAEGVETRTPVQFSAPQSPDAPDISEVEVGQDFTSQILLEGNWDKADIIVNKTHMAPVISTPVRKKKVIAPLTEENVYKKHLVMEYKKKVQDLEELVSLMEEAGVIQESVGTTVGTGGEPIMGGAPKDPFRSSRKRGKNGFSDRLRRRKQV